MDIQPAAEFCAFSDPMVKLPATRRVLLHDLVNVFLVEFKFSAGLASGGHSGNSETKLVFAIQGSTAGRITAAISLFGTTLVFG